MDHITELFSASGSLTPYWNALVWAYSVFLLFLGAIALAVPQLARRFFGGFVRSPTINMLEAVLRFIAGIALWITSSEMRRPEFFYWFGVFLAATAILLALFYPVHKKYAEWAIPFALDNVRLIGVLSLALGGFIIWALL